MRSTVIPLVKNAAADALPRRTVICALAALCVVAALPPRAEARRVVVKMATLVPDGSSWHQVLKETAHQWKTISGGRVVVRLYAGGVAGDDPDVVRKMRLGTLNAAVLTSVGVAEIDRSVFALGVPMMYSSYEEVYAVLEKMRPKIEADLLEKGFVALNWVDGGWVHFFTKKPVAEPDDLRRLKMFVWAGDHDTIDLYNSARFNPVPLPATEIATALQTGLVSALGVPPQVSVLSQYFLHARNMTDLRWQLLLGTTLIKRETWEKIPADLRPALVKAAREMGAKLQAEIRSSEKKDIDAMKKRGLNVVTLTPRQRAEWLELAESLYPQIRGNVVPAESFDAAMRYRDELRAAGGN
jgi:TRAP-type C4-dicarboxylate transport system substrate-binding protein